MGYLEIQASCGSGFIVVTQVTLRRDLLASVAASVAASCEHSGSLCLVTRKAKLC
jgi:hypothetical protein